jgi:hypothetical protein
MAGEINITVERLNHGDWINIYIPKSMGDNVFAEIQNNRGELLRKLTLAEGRNLIDISFVTDKELNIKIESAYHTLLKKIEL